jgi:hypothetical protein
VSEDLSREQRLERVLADYLKAEEAGQSPVLVRRPGFRTKGLVLVASNLGVPWAKPGDKLPLGKVLDEYHVGSLDALRTYLDDPKQFIP